MDDLHYTILAYVRQMDDVVAEMRAAVLMSGAMPSEFKVHIQRKPMGHLPRFGAVLVNPWK